MNLRILLTVNEIRYTCGVTSHVSSLIEVLKSNKIEFEIICGAGNRVEEFRANGITVHSYDFIRHQNRSIFNFFRSLFQISVIIFRFKPNIVHTHHHYQSFLVRVISFFYPVAVLQSNHGIIPKVTSIPILSGHYFTVLNHNIKNHLLESGIKERNIFLIGHAMKVQLKKEKSHEIIRVICASRFSEEKRIVDFIQAVSKLSPQIKSKAQFEIAGEGELQNYLEVQIKINGSEIILSKSYPDLTSRLLDTHIFVFTSQSQTEGLPITILEAGLSGNIVISSDYDGYDVILKHLENSVIYKNGNVDELTEWFERIIVDYDSYKYCAENLYLTVSKNHSEEIFTESIIGIYRVIISDFN